MADSLTGLFLGAGASWEVGMPLAWELTEEFKAQLAPETLHSFNRHSRRHGGGYNEEVIDELVKVLAREELHYEAVLGHYETQFRRHGPWAQTYHALYVWLVDLIYGLLLERHLKNERFIQATLRRLDGVARLAGRNKPLWVFSLNHDMIVECIAATHGIPVSSGFSDQILTLPRRDARGNKIGELHAEVLTSESLEKTGMPFLQNGRYGINLFKVHGALDIFAINDGKDLAKLVPVHRSVPGILRTLYSVNNELLYYEPTVPGQRIRSSNEIIYTDDSGQAKFLRRSLLAGAYKFDSRASQVLPQRLLEHFGASLNYVSELICIGYGFGDLHVNQILRQWLESWAERRLIIVNPIGHSVPSFLLHVSSQVVCKPVRAGNFLDTHTGIARSRGERLVTGSTFWLRESVPYKQRRAIVRALKAAEARSRAFRDRTAAWRDRSREGFNRPFG